MNKNVSITFNNGKKNIYEENTLEFSALICLFKMLLEDKLPKSGVSDKDLSDDVLHYVDKYDIKIIEFGSCRRYTFIMKECEHHGRYYEILCDVVIPSLDEVLASMNDNTKVQIFGGTLADLEKFGAGKPPEAFRKIFDEIKSKMETKTNQDKRQTHETTSTKH